MCCGRYDGAVQAEVQQVWCDATAGSFTLTIFGETTADIFVGDSAADVQARLQELTRLNNVNVTLGQGVNQACNDCAAYGCVNGFNVTFYDVEGASGNMPLMTANVQVRLGA